MGEEPAGRCRPATVCERDRVLSSGPILVRPARGTGSRTAHGRTANQIHAAVSSASREGGIFWPRTLVRALGGTLHGRRWTAPHGPDRLRRWRRADLYLHRGTK